jgi:hypothetical protein
MKCFGTPKANQNSSTKTSFFLSHEPKRQQKLALMKIAKRLLTGTKPTYDKKGEKSFGRLQGTTPQGRSVAARSNSTVELDLAAM